VAWEKVGPSFQLPNGWVAASDKGRVSVILPGRQLFGTSSQAGQVPTEPMPPEGPDNRQGLPPTTPNPVVVPRSSATLPLGRGVLPPKRVPTPPPPSFDLSPGMSIPGAQGPTSIGGPVGPTPLMPPARPGSPASAGSAPTVEPVPPPLRYVPEAPRNFGPFTVPAPDRNRAVNNWALSSQRNPAALATDGVSREWPSPLTSLFGNDPSNPLQAASTPPSPLGDDGYGAQPQWRSGQIGDGKGIGYWWENARSALQPLSQGIAWANPPSPALPPSSSPGSDQPFMSALATPASPISYLPPAPQDKPGGILGMLIDAGHIDPANPDRPAPGGLLGMIQDYLRNNPDAGR
jgi:hypothetical protein